MWHATSHHSWPALYLLCINDFSLVFRYFILTKILIKNVNGELEKISQWLKTNKLLRNEISTKFTLFHKPRNKDKLPLQLPNLQINTYDIKKTSSIKFLCVLFEENLI